MLGVAALVLFIVAAIAAFTHTAGTMVVLGLLAVGLACLAAAVSWPSFAPWRRTP